jgi:hypothetical protein
VDWCLEVRCVEPLLNGSDRCYYHRKLADGYLADSTGRYHAEPRERPKMLVGDDGWAQADVATFEWLAAMPD